MGARVNLAGLAGPAAPAKVPTFAGASAPARPVRTHDIAANPLNTRTVTTNDARQMATSLATHGQLQACVVVSRTAFLRIFTEHEAAIGDAAYVQVTGARRLAGARHGNRPTLDVQVKDNLAADRVTFLAATAAENLDRKDLNPIEEAHAIRIICDEDGVTQKDAADKLGRTPAWVTQRLHLLQLSPELQDRVVDGTLGIEAARNIGRLPADEQADAYQRLLAGQHTPAPAEPGDGATGEPEKPAASPDAVRRRVTTAVRHLGNTGAAIAHTLTEVLPDPELRELYDTLHTRFATEGGAPS